MDQTLSAPERAAKYLGIGLGRTPLAWVQAAERGLPVAKLETFARVVAPEDAGFKYRIVRKATFARRKEATPALLTRDESERLMRLAQVFAFAEEVWGGRTTAVRFMNAPHGLLDGATPLDVTVSGEMGARLVEDILGRLAHGVAV